MYKIVAYVKMYCIFVPTKKNNIMTTQAERFTVKQIVKFGMLFGYRVYDNLEKKSTAFEYDDESEWRANSKCELMNALNN